MLQPLSMFSTEDLVQELSERYRALIFAALPKDDEQYIHACEGSATECYGLLKLIEMEMNMEMFKHMAGQSPSE